MDTNIPEKLLAERDKINAIDQKIIPLLIERMECSERVALVKREYGLPVLNPKREKEILDSIGDEAGKYSRSIAAIYSNIFSVSRAKQHDMLANGNNIRNIVAKAQKNISVGDSEVICQGVEGAYAHIAARKLVHSSNIRFVQSWKDVFEGIKNGGNGVYGVLPIENSAAGSVTEVYDLILKYEFYIVQAVDIKVEHCLAALKDSEKITTVISHPQAIYQCSEFIDNHSLKSIEFSNTAAAAKYILEKKPPNTAAICSKEAALNYGLDILENSIQNSRNNTTRFILISKKPIFPENSNKISLCFSLPHRTGSLYSILERFALAGLSLTKIESRPIAGKNFEYNFFLDFLGSIYNHDTLELICALSDELPEFYFLGNYCEEGEETYE